MTRTTMVMEQQQNERRDCRCMRVARRDHMVSKLHVVLECTVRQLGTGHGVSPLRCIPASTYRGIDVGECMQRNDSHPNYILLGVRS